MYKINTMEARWIFVEADEEGDLRRRDECVKAIQNLLIGLLMANLEIKSNCLRHTMRKPLHGKHSNMDPTIRNSRKTRKYMK